MADTSRTLIIESSPAKLLVLVGIGVLMTAVSITVALLPGTLTYRKILAGYFGPVFFGLCTGVALWRLLTTRGAVITISPEGIRDTRIAAALIPWSAVTGISTWKLHGQKVMVLAIKPGVEGRPGIVRATLIGPEQLGHIGEWGFILQTH
jgi:hypothetical protein